MSENQYIDVGRVSDVPGLLEHLRANSAEFAGPFRRQRPQRPFFQRRRQGQPPAEAEAAEAPMDDQPQQEEVAGAGPQGYQARRPVHMPGVLVPDYGPHTQISPNIRIQTQRGFRAAVIQLAPGLTLVAEVPSSACHPQLGLDPVLTPLLINAAASALTNPQVQQGIANAAHGVVQAGQTAVTSIQHAFRPQPSPRPQMQRPPPPWAPPAPSWGSPAPPWAQPEPWIQPAPGPLMMVGYQPHPAYSHRPHLYEMSPVEQSPIGWAPPAFGCEGCGGKCQGAGGCGRW